MTSQLVEKQKYVKKIRSASTHTNKGKKVLYPSYFITRVFRMN